jgi:hypothetical protein
MQARKLTTLVLFSVALFAGLASASEPTAPLPTDLCEEPVLSANGAPYVDEDGDTISRFCEPRVNPPVLDRDVCCSIGTTATCKLPTAVGRCMTGMKFWCEYGTITGSGSTATVECFQPGPSMCALAECLPGPGYITYGTVFEDSSWVCCPAGDDCYYVGESADGPPAGSSCAGSFAICNWGATADDGGVECVNGGG